MGTRVRICGGRKAGWMVQMYSERWRCVRIHEGIGQAKRESQCRFRRLRDSPERLRTSEVRP